MTNVAMHKPGTRRRDITYSRSWLFALVPVALLFSLACVGALFFLVIAFFRADGGNILFAGVCFVGSIPLVAMAWWNVSRTLRDRRIQRKQLES